MKSKVENIIFIILVVASVIFIIRISSTMQSYENQISELKTEIAKLKEETQLDPCPVCDGHNTHICRDNEEYDISIKCDDCGTVFGFYQDLSDALAIWNNVKG
jgi:uncharacterized protein YoxC